MHHRPDPANVLRRWLAIDDDPAAALAALAASLRDEPGLLAAEAPLLAWPLLGAQRATGGRPTPDLLTALGRILDAWELRHGLAANAAGPISVAAQAWLVQDLHCLADLHHLAGAPGGEAWSERGHRAERALHATLWRAETRSYADRGGDGRLRPAAEGDELAVLLLLDTPGERVARLAERIDAAGLAAAPPAIAWLAGVGLQRHRREADAVAAALAMAPDAERRRAARLIAATP